MSRLRVKLLQQDAACWVLCFREAGEGCAWHCGGGWLCSGICLCCWNKLSGQIAFSSINRVGIFDVFPHCNLSENYSVSRSVFSLRLLHMCASQMIFVLNASHSSPVLSHSVLYR